MISAISHTLSALSYLGKKMAVISSNVAKIPTGEENEKRAGTETLPGKTSPSSLRGCYETHL